MIKKFLTKKAFYIAAAVILASAVLCVCYLRSRAPGYDNLTRKEDLILFLDKMVNTILSCAYRADRQWR